MTPLRLADPTHAPGEEGSLARAGRAALTCPDQAPPHRERGLAPRGGRATAAVQALLLQHLRLHLRRQRGQELRVDAVHLLGPARVRRRRRRRRCRRRCAGRRLSSVRPCRRPRRAPHNSGPTGRESTLARRKPVPSALPAACSSSPAQSTAAHSSGPGRGATPAAGAPGPSAAAGAAAAGTSAPGAAAAAAAGAGSAAGSSAPCACSTSARSSGGSASRKARSMPAPWPAARSL